MNNSKTHVFKSINSFAMDAKYVDVSIKDLNNEDNSHIHNECEIYVNISGDVSFMVEDKIYPIKRGDILITRPHEFHHCIYHSSKSHKHYWILFSCNNNENLLDVFFKRERGVCNLITPPPDTIDELFAICDKLTKENPGDFEKYYLFSKLLLILENSKKTPPEKLSLYPDFNYAIEYINKNFSQNLSIKDISESAYVSINTLERHFKTNLGISPKNYIKKVRLANAVKMLNEGLSVQETCNSCGFCDCSKFIADFKAIYGKTPYKYIKSLRLSAQN